MYAQTERGTTVDWADHIIIMIYAIAGALYSVYLAGVGFFGVFTNVNIMFTKPSPDAFGSLLLSLLLIIGGLILASTAFNAFTRMLREGPNPDPKVMPARKPTFMAQVAERLFPELQDATKRTSGGQQLTAKQAQRVARDEQREELTEQVRRELARRRANRAKNKRKHH